MHVQVQLPMAVAEPEFVAQLSLLAPGAPSHSLHDMRPTTHIWGDFSWHWRIELAWLEPERLCLTAEGCLETCTLMSLGCWHSAAAPLLLQYWTALDWIE